ncbi:MAG: transposase, partial [Candidatus Scalindua sp.]
ACGYPPFLHTISGRPDFFNLSEIMHSIKSYTAHEIKKLRKQQGSVWIHESYDRIIRDEAEFQDKFRYIYENPIKEGLVESDKEYPWLYFGEGYHRMDNRDGCPTNDQDGCPTNNRDGCSTNDRDGCTISTL